MPQNHHIGLHLGTEDDWPTAFESVLDSLKLEIKFGGESHTFSTERITIEPFDLRYVPKYHLVIDRLAWWHLISREWLKKIALMDDVYLLNSPFTFQAMEKHAAYCAMIRLGLRVPTTWMLPVKQPVANERYAETAARYHQPFQLEQVAAEIGYPLYMKPFDGGQWVGVTRIPDDDTLHRAYDESGERLMHLQRAVEPFDVFVRSLSIGAETMVMNYDPSQPLHARYQLSHNFLTPEVGYEVVTIGRTINAFFRWEMNSCESLVQGSTVSPIDYANASPDVAVTSLHYYFPWAISALLKWSIFCATTGRRMRLDQETRSWFDVGDNPDASYEEKLRTYRELADAYFELEAYRDFCDSHLAHLDEVMVEYIESADFDRLLVSVVTDTFPPHEHDHFVGHYRGLLAAWASDQRKSQAAAGGAAEPTSEKPAKKAAKKSVKKSVKKSAEKSVKKVSPPAP